MLPNLIIAVIITILFFVLGGYIFRWVKSGLSKSPININLAQLLANIARLAILCLGFVTALGVLELEKIVFSLLAGVGVIGLALGFAFRDLAANFIAGVMLAVRSPIQTGDYIEIGKTTGTVGDIRLRDTVVQGSGGEEIFVPNKDFTSNQFTNFSRSGKRRIKIEVGIGYECNSNEALTIITQTLNSLDAVLEDKPAEAYVDKLGASTVDLVGYIWIKYPGTNFSKMKSDAIIKVKRALEAAKISLPSPIQEIDLRPEIKALFDKSR